MSGPNPYRDAPKRSFWSSFAARGFDTSDLVRSWSPRLRPGAKVVSAGSCFAANMVPSLEQHGFEYVREEYTAPVFRRIEPENLSYAKFSAAYGNVYTTRQLLQLLRRCTGQWQPQEDRWILPDRVVDPFRPGLRYPARSEREFDALTRAHLAATRRAFEAAEVFVFTLGLTEAWESSLDGAVFPACPGTVAGAFDANRHRFVNFTAAEVRADLERAIVELRRLSPDVDVILTVSPVPLVATADGGHVLEATVYSKSVLRVAAGEVAREVPRVTYFPSYEIITGTHAPRAFFEDDRRSVSRLGIEAVMRVFFGESEPGAPAASGAVPSRSDAIQALGEQIVALECEEAFADGARADPDPSPPSAPAHAPSTQKPLNVAVHVRRSRRDARTRVLGLRPNEATVSVDDPFVVRGVLVLTPEVEVSVIRARARDGRSVTARRHLPSPKAAISIPDEPSAANAGFAVDLGRPRAGDRWSLEAELRDGTTLPIADVRFSRPA